jgi:antitoxin component YwqK of YwqJK toxin-antitoxin module
MKNLFFLSFLAFFLFSCSGKEKKVVEESYPDGTPKIEKYYKGDDADKELTKEIQYYPNKQVMMEGEYKDEKRDGDWVCYFQDGKKWSEGSFKDGLDEGKRTVYYENGQKRYEGEYSKGEEIGVWNFWDENGKLDKTVDYDTIKK